MFNINVKRENKHEIRPLLAIALMLGLLGAPSAAFAADGAPPVAPLQKKNINGLRPNWKPSPEAQKRIAQKETLAAPTEKRLNRMEKAARLHVLGGGAATPVAATQLNVAYLPEPNEYKYRNYCGPTATRVALSARMPVSQIPSIDQVGKDQFIDPSMGVYADNVLITLNRYLNTSFYELSVPKSAAELRAKIVFDIDRNYSPIFGVPTFIQRPGYLPGWRVSAPHIVAGYGYDMDSSGYWLIKYVDTASNAAGYFGPYHNTIRSVDLWPYNSNSSQTNWVIW